MIDLVWGLKTLNTLVFFVIWTLFYCATLNGRWNKKTSVIGMMVFYIFILLPVSYFLYFDFWVKFAAVAILKFIALRILFKDGVLRIIFVQVMETILGLLPEIVQAVAAELIFHLPLLEALNNIVYAAILSFAVFYPAGIIIFIIGTKVVKKTAGIKTDFNSLLGLGFFPLSQLFILVYLAFLIMFKTDSIYGPYLIAFIICIILSVAADILLYHTMKETAKKAQLEAENHHLNVQKELQLQHYQAYVEQQNSIRNLRHDIMNHVQTIKILIGENEMAEANEYADKLAARFDKITTIDYCENKVIDAVLHNKVEYAASLGVEASVKTAVPAKGKVDDLDLMAIFSNLLDNAIQAAAKSSGDKYISVSSAVNSGFMVIKVENTGDGSEINPEKKPKNGDRHGLGLGIISDTAKRWGGSFNITQENGIYRGIVTLEWE